MARGAGIVFVGIFLARLLGYILRIVLKHVLGLETFGLLWSSYNVVEIVTFFCLLGISNALARYIAYYKAQNNPRRVGGFIVMGLSYILPIVLLVMFFMFWQVDFFADTLFRKPEIKPFLQVLCFGLLPLTLMYIFAGIFRGFKLMPQMIFTQQLSRNIFIFLCFGLFALFGLSRSHAVWAMLSGLALTALVAILLFLRYVDKAYFSNIELGGVFPELWSYSWPLVFTTLFGNMSGRVDIFFLTIYESESNIGVYSAILPLAQFIPVFMQSFISILMPIFAGVFANYEKNALLTMQQAASKWIIAFTVPLFLILLVFSDQILLALLGADTLVGTLPLCIAAIGYFFNAVFGVFNVILSAAGRTKLALLNTTTYMVVNILFDILLIPRFGLSGAAMAGSLGMIAMSFLIVIENYKLFDLKPVSKQILQILFIGVLAAGASFGFKILFSFHIKLVSIAAGSFLFILLYFTGLKKIHIFDHNDLAIISAVENKFGKKLTLLRRFVE